MDVAKQRKLYTGQPRAKVYIHLLNKYILHKIRVSEVEIIYFESATALVIKLNPNDPYLGFLNEKLGILVAQGAGKLPEVKV